MMENHAIGSTESTGKAGLGHNTQKLHQEHKKREARNLRKALEFYTC